MLVFNITIQPPIPFPSKMVDKMVISGQYVVDHVLILVPVHPV